jgi:hypothetical protein
MGLLFYQVSIRISLVVLAAVFLASAPGCGEAETSLDRKPVTGTVSYEGKTDCAGKIGFYPTSGGPAANTAIVDGRYTFDANNGPIAGKYRVRVMVENPAARAGGGGGARGGKGGGSGSPPEYLPQRSTEIEVPAEGPFEIEIEV